MGSHNSGLDATEVAVLPKGVLKLLESMLQLMHLFLHASCGLRWNAVCSFNNLKPCDSPPRGFRGWLETRFSPREVAALPKGALEVLESMLQLDPKKRTTATAALTVSTALSKSQP